MILLPSTNKYVQEVECNPLKDVDLGLPPGLFDAPLPTAVVDDAKFEFSDFKYFLKKTSNASESRVTIEYPAKRTGSSRNLTSIYCVYF